MCKDKVRYYRKLRGYSQEQLAEMLGYKSFTTIQKWEDGTSMPPVGTVSKLSQVLGVSMMELTSDVPSNPTGKPNRINVLGSVPAGVPIEAIEDIVDFEDIPEEWLAGNREYFGLKIKGDSMYPKYLEGDTIIVCKQSDCESGQDAVVYVNGYDATLKRVIKQQFGIMLQPLNPDYEPKIYDYDDELNPVTILGVVVEIRRKV